MAAYLGLSGSWLPPQMSMDLLYSIRSIQQLPGLVPSIMRRHPVAVVAKLVQRVIPNCCVCRQCLHHSNLRKNDSILIRLCVRNTRLNLIRTYLCGSHMVGEVLIVRPMRKENNNLSFGILANGTNPGRVNTRKTAWPTSATACSTPATTWSNETRYQLAHDDEVQLGVLSITVVTALVSSTIGSKPPFVMLYFLVMRTFYPPNDFF